MSSFGLSKTGGKSLQVVSISDIHLGHPRTSTIVIAENLKTYLFNPQLLSSTDIVFFAGDVFDSLLRYDSGDVGVSEDVIFQFLRACIRHDVVVRVLEGTPSHDRKQSSCFDKLSSFLHSVGLEPDVAYMTTLTIEHIERFGINVLYVPDEYRHDCADTLTEVMELMDSKGLSQVDFSIMHGCFNYQLPEITKQHTKHSEADYLALTKHLIFIGHVHTHSSFDRIFAQGSFDRLAHGEEEPKGFLKAVVHADDTYQVNFIENKGAEIYRTLYCKHAEVEQALKHIASEIKVLPPNSKVRVVVEPGSALVLSADVLSLRWPALLWTIKKDDEKGIRPQSIDLVDKSPRYTPLIINESTIESLVMARLQAGSASAPLCERIALKLKELL